MQLTKDEQPAKKPNPKEAKIIRKGNLFVITGPSGVGKGTVVERVLTAVSGINRAVTVTTRAKRQGEVEGIDYFFRSKEDFDEMRRQDALIEWAEFAGAFYGTPSAWIEKELASGHDVLLVIEVQGAKQVRLKFPSAVLIFLAPPSLGTLEERLVGRATETPDKIALRLDKAKQEMLEKHLFHYEVINDNIDQAVDNLIDIIMAERCRIPKSG